MLNAETARHKGSKEREDKQKPRRKKIEKLWNWLMEIIRMHQTAKHLASNFAGEPSSADRGAADPSRSSVGGEGDRDPVPFFFSPDFSESFARLPFSFSRNLSLLLSLERPPSLSRERERERWRLRERDFFPLLLESQGKQKRLPCRTKLNICTCLIGSLKLYSAMQFLDVKSS